MTDSDSPSRPPSIPTVFTKMLGCEYPVIAAPMFLVSNEEVVLAASGAGGVGAVPSLNWRSADAFDQALRRIAARTRKPYAVNLIVNTTSQRREQDLEIVVSHKVPLVITSLGNPQSVIDKVHAYGGKVFCDVTGLKYARKVEEQGADGVIAVSSGAGGHAGAVSPMVLLPYLKKHLKIPIVAAGGIVHGGQILAALVLGADAVQAGTRFIATREAGAGDDYKNAVLNSEPEDIVMTRRISGTPAAVINTPYVEKMGLDLNPLERFLNSHPLTMRYAKLIRASLGARSLKAAVDKATWKTVWSAGQGVGLIDEILPAADAMRQLAAEYWEARNRL